MCVCVCVFVCACVHVYIVVFVCCRAELSSPPEQYEEDGPIVSEGVEPPHPVLLQAKGSSRWAAFISSGHEVCVPGLGLVCECSVPQQE